MEYHLFVSNSFSCWYTYLQISNVFPEVFNPSTANEFVIHSFHFAEEICQQDSNLHMASLDVYSLLTNIPVEKTINICVDNLYNDNENPPNIPKHDVL